MRLLHRAWARAAFALLCALSGVAAWAQASPATTLTGCSGKFANPITEVCWKCMFPMTIGAARVQGGSPLFDLPFDEPPPFCTCPGTPIKPGFAFGMWEPVRIVDVTRKPFCFAALGADMSGLAGAVSEIMPVLQHGRTGAGDEGKSTSYYQAHWYANPLLYLLQLVVDFVCLQPGGFDLLWLTEWDPTWNQDELASLLAPEGLLFSNIFVQMSCGLDCAASTFIMPIPLMPWCAGCNGPTFPLDGWVPAHLGGVQAAALIAERMHHKMQRQGLEWMHHTPLAACAPQPNPVYIDKWAMRTQLQYPVPQTAKFPCCSWFGSATIESALGAEIPVVGEDFSFLLFRKRSCCAL